MIKNNLNVLLAERDYTATDLHEGTGISKTTLTSLVNNTGKGVQMDTIDKICNFLDVDVSEFFIYSPYMIDFEYAPGGNSPYITDDEYIKIKATRKGIERSFYLELYFFSPDAARKSNNIILDEPYALEVQVGTNNSENPFFPIFKELNIGFRKDFYNELKDFILSRIKKTIKNENTYIHVSSNNPNGEKINLTEDDNVAIVIFPHDKDLSRVFYSKIDTL